MWDASEALSGESVHRRYVVHVLWYRPPNAMHLKVDKLSCSAEQRSNPCGLPPIIGMISMHETMVCMVGIRLFAAGFGMVACVCVVFVC